jgi:D-3-phosphoglycerate dehydrogenase / 2-oxoglutarate reductase
MKITMLDDYQGIIRKLKCFDMMRGHNVQIFNRTYKDPQILADKLYDTNILLLTREKAFENVLNYMSGKPTNIANPQVL